MTSSSRSMSGAGLGGGEADAARRLRMSGYLWRRDPLRRRSRGRGPALIAAIVGYLTVCGLLVWVALWMVPPRPAGLVLAGAGYETNLAVPPNVFGKASLRILADLTRRHSTWRFWGSRRLRIADGPRVLRTVADLRAWEKRLADRPEKTLLIYLTLHGAVDMQNRPCLLVDDVGHERGFIPLTDILAHLKAGPLASKKRVLLLDATGLDSAWHIGVLSNDFALALEGLDRQIADDPNLVVVSASGPGQRSWPAPASGTTAFGLFVAEGLAGAAVVEFAADPITGEVRKSDRMNARDLYRYVRNAVRGWARTERGAEQSPVLFPSGPLGEARAAACEITTGLEPLSTEARTHSPTPLSSALRDAWASYQRLVRSDPHPAAYAPQLWTLYQATVLRGDELERSGDPASARILFDRLASLRRQIDEARVLPLGSSAGATLGMSAIEGNWPLSAGKTPGDVASSLWSPPEGSDRAGVWQRVRQQLPDADVRRLRSQLYFQALVRVEDDPARNFQPAVDLVRALDDPSRPRAAEVHDLLMYTKRPIPPSGRTGGYDEALARAVRVRRRAEEAALGIDPQGRYPFSEQVEPWIRRWVEQGDRERRIGQDLLFATDTERWDEAVERLESARGFYRKAGAAAETVRAAVALRDEVLPILPAYSRWLVRRPDANDASVNAVVALWADVHELVRALESSAPEATDAGLDDLHARFERVDKSYTTLRTQFRAAVENAARSRGPSGQSWRAAEALLEVPFFDRDPSALAPGQDQGFKPERLAIVESWRSPESKSAGRQDETSATPSRLIPSDDTLRATREARVALAAIGRRWFFETDAEPAVAESELADSLALLEPGKPRPTVIQLVDIGRKIGLRYSDLAGGRASRPGPSAPGAAGPLDLYRLLVGARRETPAQAAERLRSTDRLSRLLDPAGAEHIVRLISGGTIPGQPSLTADHLQALRKWRVRSLLIRQAERIDRDHWYQADEGALTPYYRVSGLALLNDAQSVIEPLTLPFGPELAERRASLTHPDPLRVVGLPEIVVTDQPRIELSYRIETAPGSGPREGVPYLWAEPVAGLTVANPPPGMRVGTRLLAEGAGAVANGQFGALTCQLVNPLNDEGDPRVEPPRAAASLVIHGFFRGQSFEFRTKLDLHRAADIVVDHPPRLESAGVALQTQAPVRSRLGTVQGAIAFVVDASGSMGPPEGQPADANTKYAIAVKTLERVLRELPAGLIVSVYQFGAARPNHAKVSPEQTIETVFGPARWDPSSAAALGDKLRAAEPWDESPIIRTILRARDDLLALGDIGFRSIVVVTDGDDNRFAQDQLLNPDGRSIPDFLAQTFRDGKVQLNVVGFRAPDLATETKLKQQFQAITKLPLPGRFYYAEDLDRLEINLTTMMKQEMTFKVRREAEGGGGLTVAERETPIGRLEDDSGRYPEALPPGGYKVSLTADPRVSRSIALDGGDQLLLGLTETAGKLTLERRLCPDDRFPGLIPSSRASGDWRLTVYSAGFSPDRTLRLFNTLERDPTLDPPTVRIPRPREVLIELKAETAESSATARPTTARYRWADYAGRDGLPAPAWSLTSPSWPSFDPSNPEYEPSRPTVETWWLDAGIAPAAAVLHAGSDFIVDAPGDLNRNVNAAGAAVTVVGVHSETHRVPVSAESFEPKPCLVVRLVSPARHRVWARLRDVGVAGLEHRFYATPTAWHYTGVFWTTTPSEALTRVGRIELVEEQSFKETCRAAKSTALLTLGTPDPRDVPLPPAIGTGARP